MKPLNSTKGKSLKILYIYFNIFLFYLNGLVLEKYDVGFIIF